MAKFKFGSHPKTFHHTVKFKTLDGVQQEMKVEYNFRTRSQFGEFFDTMRDAAVKERGGAELADMSMSEIMEATRANNGQYILGALASWELEDDLNADNAQRLADEYPAAADAVMEAYRKACLEGRLGN